MTQQHTDREDEAQTGMADRTYLVELARDGWRVVYRAGNKLVFVGPFRTDGAAYDCAFREAREYGLRPAD